MKRILLTTILISAVALPLVISSSLRVDAAVVNFEQYITDVTVSEDKQYITVEVPLTDCYIEVVKQGYGPYATVNGTSWFEFFESGEVLAFNFMVYPMGYDGGFFTDNIPNCTINIDFNVKFDDSRTIVSAQSSILNYDIDSNLLKAVYSDPLSLTNGPGAYSISLPYTSSSDYSYFTPRLQVFDTTNFNVSPYIIEFQLNSLTFEFVTEDFITVDDNTVTNGLLTQLNDTNSALLEELRKDLTPEQQAQLDASLKLIEERKQDENKVNGALDNAIGNVAGKDPFGSYQDALQNYGGLADNLAFKSFWSSLVSIPVFLAFIGVVIAFAMAGYALYGRR